MKKYTLFLIPLLLLFSCKTVQYVPIETVKVKDNYIYSRDSVYLYDSVFMKIKGDTVWLEKYKYLYRDKLIKDSVYIRDSIQVPYPVTITKEVNRLRTWQIVLMCLGAASIAVLGYKLFRLFR